MATYDLNMMSPVKSATEVPLIFDNTKNSSTIKLAQRCLVLLLKDAEEGLYEGDGTDLGSYVRGANVPDMGSLRGVCAIAAANVKQLLLADQALDLERPDDEKIESLTVTADQLSSTDVKITVEITSVAGAQAAASITI
jgi:hypothetical protein